MYDLYIHLHGTPIQKNSRVQLYKRDEGDLLANHKKNFMKIDFVIQYQ